MTREPAPRNVCRRRVIPVLGAVCLFLAVVWLVWVLVDEPAITGLRANHRTSWSIPLRHILGQASTAMCFLGIISLVWTRSRAGALVTALLAVALAGALVVSVKGLVRRNRPDLASYQPRSAPAGFLGAWSFPSGDASEAFAAATGLALFASLRWRWALFIVAAAVAVNRVLVLQHWPSDVIAGAGLGIMCGYASLLIYRSWLEKPLAGLTQRFLKKH